MIRQEAKMIGQDGAHCSQTGGETHKGETPNHQDAKMNGQTTEGSKTGERENGSEVQIGRDQSGDLEIDETLLIAHGLRRKRESLTDKQMKTMEVRWESLRNNTG